MTIENLTRLRVLIREATTGVKHMSVATFSTEELAILAHVIVRDRPTYFHDGDHTSDLREACKALALISQANVACFNDRYRHLSESPAEACTAEEIEAEARTLTSRPGDTTTLARALSTANLLHYNCDDSGGDFTLKVEGAAAALIRVLECLCGALARKAGVST